jgi:hypothetical protein
VSRGIGRQTVDRIAGSGRCSTFGLWGFRCLCVAALVLGVSSCSDAQEGTSGTPPPGAFPRPAPALPALQGGTQEGDFVTYVADFDDGHSERWHALRMADGREVRLAFDAAPTLAYGTRVRVHGDLVSEGLHVNDFEVLSTPQTVESVPETIAAPPSPDTFALVLVDLGAGVNVDAGAGQTTMFSTNPADKSFASFYFESSYGKYSVTGAVVGPFPFTMTTCDTTGMAAAIEPLIKTKYNHLIYYFNRSNLCTFGGLGEEGSVAAPAMRTWMNGSLSCVVLMQEPGHNLGLMHANTISCGTSSFSTTPATSCTITEYGSTVTPMGSGCHQLNGYEKWYEQWLSGCNGVRVTSTGTFNLVPLGDSCPGAVQVLQVPMPATLTVNDPQATTTNVSLKDYYVELRAAAGSFDQYTAAGRAGGGGAAVTYTAPTVYVYASDDVHPGTAVRGSTVTRNSVWTELINMTPGSTSFTGLTAAGQSFHDPAGGATITLQSISATGAIIGVTVPNGTGGPTCIDGTTLGGSSSACDGGAVVIPPFDAGTPVTTPDAGVDAGVDAATDAGAAKPDATTGTTPDAGTGARDAGGVATAEAGSGGSSSGGAGSGAADAGSGRASDGSLASDAEMSASFGASTQGGGCGCETVGDTKAQNRQGAWLAIGALAMAGWGSRRRRERTRRRAIEALGRFAAKAARDRRDGSRASKSES